MEVSRRVVVLDGKATASLVRNYVRLMMVVVVMVVMSEKGGSCYSTCLGINHTPLGVIRACVWEM